jgi:hypothetical protein
LIDGVAGLAILGIAVSLRAYLRPHDDRLSMVVLGAGIAAAIASFAQATIGLILTYQAAHGSSAGHVRTLFHALNDGDTFKIAFLAVMIGAASVIARRAEAFPHWLAVGGIVFAPLLALSGLAFPFDSDVLYATLELTLLLLLTWVVAVTVVTARRLPASPEGAPALGSS